MGLLSNLGIRTSLSQVPLLKKNRDITYFLSCKKDTKNIDPKVVKTKINKQVIISR